jgi:hypothetical protein
MAQPRPWVEEVLDALGELGGEGKLDDIYGMIHRRSVMDLTGSVDWRATVRRTIQQHSSASDAFSGKAGDDIFIPPRGLVQKQERLPRVGAAGCHAFDVDEGQLRTSPALPNPDNLA